MQTVSHYASSSSQAPGSGEADPGQVLLSFVEIAKTPSLLNAPGETPAASAWSSGFSTALPTRGCLSLPLTPV